jgi:hypothetical protein
LEAARGNDGSRSENEEIQLKKPDHILRDWHSVCVCVCVCVCEKEREEWENTACAQVEAEGRTEGGYIISRHAQQQEQHSLHAVHCLEVVRDTHRRMYIF